MSTFRMVLECMLSPRLTKVYGNGPVEKLYEPYKLEKWSDQILNSLYMMWKLGIYTSPLLVGFLYRKGYFVNDGLITLTKIVTGIGVILVISFCARGVGRASNPIYQKFIKTLMSAQEKMSVTNKQHLAMYDFEFYAWPVEYSWTETEGDLTKHRIQIRKPIIQRNMFQHVTTLPYYIISYLAIHTFGIRLIYPGSIGVLQTVLAQSLLQGRTKLIEVNKGVRYKLLARDNNEIDAMFIDKRNETQNGNTLVICSEGNAGFYEIGIMCTPIEAGYSTLGWNHPGFGGSTGTPFPDQEQNAIDIVIQFAINKLGFKVENILLFGWSIGGYTSTWAAMNYPQIKGLILDASFDHLLPLALNHMPRLWKSIVTLAISEYVNLNNMEQLLKYQGPVLLIRRTQDEVICTSDGVLSTNRGNKLLMKLLESRYPVLIGNNQMVLLNTYAAANMFMQDNLYQKYKVEDDVCKSYFESYVSENSASYPMNIGEDMSDLQKDRMTLFLAKKYMKDYQSTHCTPLPTDLFQMPWDVSLENDYVFT